MSIFLAVVDENEGHRTDTFSFDSAGARNSAICGFNLISSDRDWMVQFPCDQDDYPGLGPGLYERMMINGLLWCLANPTILVAGINPQADLQAEIDRHQVFLDELAADSDEPVRPEWMEQPSSGVETVTHITEPGAWQESFRLKDPDWTLKEDVAVIRVTPEWSPIRSDFMVDFPVEAFGDRPGGLAPRRWCKVLSYDGNKNCDVVVYDSWDPSVGPGMERVVRTRTKRGRVLQHAAIKDIHPGLVGESETEQGTTRVLTPICQALGLDPDECSGPREIQTNIMTAIFRLDAAKQAAQTESGEAINLIGSIEDALGISPLGVGQTNSAAGMVSRIIDRIEEMGRVPEGTSFTAAADALMERALSMLALVLGINSPRDGRLSIGQRICSFDSYITGHRWVDTPEARSRLVSIEHALDIAPSSHSGRSVWATVTRIVNRIESIGYETHSGKYLERALDRLQAKS